MNQGRSVVPEKAPLLRGTSRDHLSEALRSGVRSIESGLFEEARASLNALLRVNPADVEARYFLHFIDRRLMPLASGPTALLWQVDPAGAWERDWVRTLVSGCTDNEVVDGTWTATAPRMVVVDNGLVEAKESYYRRAFEQGCRIVLLHLSDEAFRDDTGAYRYCEAVLRNYRSEVLAAQARVSFFPLGFKSGFGRAVSAARPASSRRYLWSFAGDAKKSTRSEMLDSMKTLPRGFVHLTQGFGSGDSLPTEAYRDLLEESVLVPCPSGWSNLETFRVYEALEAGCIPIVERRPAFDYFTDLLGAHPIPTVSRWAEARDLFVGRSLEDLESLRQSCEGWWRAFKRRLRPSITATIKNALS